MSNNGQYTNKNTALGQDALADALAGTPGFDNTAYGYEALNDLNPGVNENSAFGSGALKNSSGGENSAFGAHALANNGAAIGNSAFGNWALRYNTGNDNTAVGFRSQAADELSSMAPPGGVSSGSRNTSVGAFTMQNKPDGNDNVAVGYDVLKNVTTGADNNSSVGSGSLYALTSGKNNTAVGYEAGAAVLTTGSSNTFVGAGADTDSASSSYRTAVGAGAVVTQDNSVVLGRVGDKVGVGVTAPDSALHVVGGSNDAVHAVAVDGDAINASTSGTGYAVYASTTGAANAIYALTGSNAAAIHAESSANITVVANNTGGGNAIRADSSAGGNAIVATVGSGGINPPTAVKAQCIGANGFAVHAIGNNTSPAIYAEGGYRNKVVILEANGTTYNATLNDYIIIYVNTTGIPATPTVNLPNPSTIPDGHTFIVRNASNQNITIETTQILNDFVPFGTDSGAPLGTDGIPAGNKDAKTFVKLTVGGTSSYYRIA